MKNKYIKVEYWVKKEMKFKDLKEAESYTEVWDKDDRYKNIEIFEVEEDKKHISKQYVKNK